MVYQTKTEQLRIDREQRHRQKVHSDPNWWKPACTLAVYDQKKNCHVAIDSWKPRQKGVPCKTVDDSIRALEIVQYGKGQKYAQVLPGGGIIYSYSVEDWIPRGQSLEAVRGRRCILSPARRAREHRSLKMTINEVKLVIR